MDLVVLLSIILAEEGLVMVLFRVGFVPMVEHVLRGCSFLFHFLRVKNSKCLAIVLVWGVLEGKRWGRGNGTEIAILTVDFCKFEETEQG